MWREEAAPKGGKALYIRVAEKGKCSNIKSYIRIKNKDEKIINWKILAPGLADPFVDEVFV